MQIGLALIGQVSKAAMGDTEQSVTTYVTRPMWRAWCRFAMIPEDSKPTDWLGFQATHRIYGSKTIIVESDQLAGVSVSSAA